MGEGRQTSRQPADASINITGFQALSSLQLPNNQWMTKQVKTGRCQQSSVACSLLHLTADDDRFSYINHVISICSTLIASFAGPHVKLMSDRSEYVRQLSMCVRNGPSNHVATRSGMTRVLKGSHSFTCTPTRSSAIAMSHTCLCLPSYSWYSFTDTGVMEG